MAGEPVVVIATLVHRKAFTQRLKLQGCDLERPLASGQLVMLDAAETLAKFMVDDMPDWELFKELVGGVIEQARLGRERARVRAYGEMVDLLWREGCKPAAIALEGAWNQLATIHSFSLLCAYVMGNFYHSGDGSGFDDVCRAHTHVIPTERYVGLDGADARLREISQLQQRARSLESEIEQRKQLEGALREALEREKLLRQEAERSVRYNQMFAGMLGHDLRNPLGAISMGANYLARMPTVDGSTKIVASRIVSSAERMARMIDQLLDFTRIRVGGGLVLNHTRLDLADLCYKVKDELEAANPECSIGLTTSGDTVGEWDYDRLLQVFSNLVGNAIAHGSSGCQVSIGTDGSDATSVVAFVHNAGAVAPDILPVIFEPFRGRNKQQKTQGLGLGLFISRQIVAAHGGTLEVVSNQDDGTTMRVQLPRTPAAAGKAPQNRVEL